MSEYPKELLAEAHVQARRLVDGLEAQQVELEANPPDLPADKLAMGKAAMTNAVAAARRSLAALEEAIRIAHYDDNKKGSA